MSTPEAANALRHGVTWADMAHMAVVRVSGDAAFELLDAVSPRPLFVRDGQMLPTLFLGDDGLPLADVYIAVDDLDYLVLADGMPGDQLATWLREHAPDGIDATVEDLSGDTAIVGLHGPYAWELLAEVVGPDVAGVPYLTSFLFDEFEGLCFRAGKTGEFGYLLWVPAARRDDLVRELERFGADFDLTSITVADLDLASLENGFFCIRHAGARDVHPLQLQLGWRVAYDRDFPGADAVRSSRELGSRLTWFQLDPSAAVPEPGTQIVVADGVRGTVVHADRSHLLGRPVGTALLPLHAAWPDLPVTAPSPGTTVAPPMLLNRSLFIDSQRHSYAGRELDDFPALLP